MKTKVYHLEPSEQKIFIDITVIMDNINQTIENSASINTVSFTKKMEQLFVQDNADIETKKQPLVRLVLHVWSNQNVFYSIFNL